jgi:hypothetical protein
LDAAAHRPECQNSSLAVTVAVLVVVVEVANQVASGLVLHHRETGDGTASVAERPVVRKVVAGRSDCAVW